MSREVSCFFYGSFMNREVMSKVGHNMVRWEVATLSGFEIRIEPHANLVRSRGGMAFGVLTPLTHSTLEALYGSQSRGELYLPEGVIVLAADGNHRAAMSYFVSEMKPGPIDPEYVEMIARPAEEYGFPEWYVRRIRSFVR